MTVNNTMPVVGGLYGSRASDGTYRVAKVLVAEHSIVHVRMYAERFATMPEAITSSDLSLGAVGSPGGFGIGHAPMALEGFLAEERTLLATEQVHDNELEGYHIWAGHDDA